MSRLTLLPFADLAKVAEAAGFQRVRGRGSHNTFRSPDGKVIVIPDHGHQFITRPLLRKIVRDMGLTVDAYNRLAARVR